MLCFVCLRILYSQTYTISGFVFDSDSKEPIKNVNTYINSDINCPLCADCGNESNIDGSFLIVCDNIKLENITINIEKIGYQSQLFSFDFEKEKLHLGNIYLKPKSIDLPSEHVHSNQEKETLISESEISGNKLNDSFSTNIAKTLSYEPNLGVMSFGVAASKPTLRSYSGNRFLIKNDGQDVGDLSQTSADHAIALDLNNINKIEIIRGPKVLIFGSNSIGGVINTVQNGNPSIRVDKFLTNLTIGGESYNQSIFGNVFLYIPIKQNQLNLSFNNIDANNQTTPIGTLENTEYIISSNKIGFTKYLKDSYLNFNYENYKMNYGIPMTPEGHIDGVDIKLSKNTFQLNYHKDIELLNLNTFNIHYNFIDYYHGEFDVNVPNEPHVYMIKYTNDLNFEFESKNSIFGAEITFKDYKYNGRYNTPDSDQLDFSLYGYNESNKTNYNLMSSFRLGLTSSVPNDNDLEDIYSLDISDVNEKSFDYLSYSFGIKNKFKNIIFNNWFISTMRAPSVEELFSDGPHLGAYSYEIGNPSLEPEKIYGIESSLKYNLDNFSLSLTSFYNYSPYYYQMTKMGDCENIIDWDGTGGHPCAGEDFIAWGKGPGGWLYKYEINGVEAIIKGLEFRFNYNINNFQINYDFSLVRGDDIGSDSYMTYINPDKHLLSMIYTKNKFRYNLRLVQTSEQNRLGEFETYTPSATVVDFVVGYNHKNTSLTFQLNNIFDETFYNHLSKIKPITPESGTNLVVSYKILF